MGYEVSYQGRIDLDPPISADYWRRFLDERPDFGALSEGVRKILGPALLPVLSEDGSEVIAIEPGPNGHNPGSMHLSLRHFAHLAALANEDGLYCDLTGHFSGFGDDGVCHWVRMTNADPVESDEPFMDE